MKSKNSYPFMDDSINIRKRLSHIDLKNGSRLIGIIKTIRCYSKILPSSYFYIIETITESYYKFNGPRITGEDMAYPLSEADLLPIMNYKTLYLIMGGRYPYITASEKSSKDWKSHVIADGNSIEEIKPDDLFELLLDSAE